MSFSCVPDVRLGRRQQDFQGGAFGRLDDDGRREHLARPARLHRREDRHGS